jgi:hypothetical protein
MNGKEAYERWQELIEKADLRGFVKSKLADENEARLEAVLVNLAHGLAYARKGGVMPPHSFEAALTAFLDIAHAAYQLRCLGAGLSTEMDGLKERAGKLQERFEECADVFPCPTPRPSPVSNQ